MKKLLLICLVFLLGNQLLSAQASFIDWEFRGGKLLANPDGTSTGPGPEPAGLDIAAIPITPISYGRLPSVVLADLDNDNDLDFISGSQGGTVHYFENNGTVTAPNWVSASIPTLDTIWIDRTRTSRNQNRPQLVDIDDDGDLDLFIGSQYNYEGLTTDDVRFYRNVGTPEIPVFSYVPACIPGLKDQDISEFPGFGFADLDNDTDLDLVALGSDKLTYYKNIGTKELPNFELQSEANSPWADENEYTNMDVPIPVFEDFDKDGDLDMYFMIDSGHVRWIENIGTVTNPNFVSPQKTMNGELTNGDMGSFPVVDFGDVNGDGLKDALLANFNPPAFAWFRQVPVCVSPTITSVTATPVTCEGETSTITITGNLNIASTWSIYTDSCGGTLVGSTTTSTSTFTVTPSSPSTTYYIRGEDGAITCIDETTATCTTVTIIAPPIDDASFNYSAAAYCTNDTDPTPTITGTIGGNFTYTPPGLSMTTSSGEIDVSTSTPGTYTVTYTTTGACPNSSDTSITINAQDNASFNYAASAYCVDDTDPTPTITGTIGGSFTSTPAGLSITGSGEIDVSTSTPGTYTVTYTTTGICPNSSNTSITINAQDNASFNYDASAYCVDESDPTPTITGTIGGSFTSTPTGLSMTASSGEIDLSSSTPGTYTVTYTTTGTCPNSDNINIIVNSLDDANFDYDQSSYSIDEPDPIPTIAGVTGGSFSSTTGLSINTTSGEIDLSNSATGTYIVTYTTAGNCENSTDQSVSITDATAEPEPVKANILVPKGFSPNGDGINDTWIIEGIHKFPDHEIQLFNRWGNVVFSAVNYQNDWNGISNGKRVLRSNHKLPTGPYYYIIDTGTKTTPFSGWIYINY
ncbi:T9SS type B sorting domain-containing protein [Aquimarina sediminis]|uniref:T9SS type B sorting domain-containing protein n=1 Tax=Aquimarina sediminis TaxID=2070536 RepID=UPI000CA057CD|nr:gliding motility-associated C-terminal domain-containing protein [Aquimarina sediminis]